MPMIDRRDALGRCVRSLVFCTSGDRGVGGRWRDGRGSARLQTVALDHTRLDHSGVQGQEHDAGVQVVASLEGGCQAH